MKTILARKESPHPCDLANLIFISTPTSGGTEAGVIPGYRRGRGAGFAFPLFKVHLRFMRIVNAVYHNTSRIKGTNACPMGSSSS